MTTRGGGVAGTIAPDTGVGWFRRFLPLLRRHRRILGVTLSSSVVGQALGYSIPVVVQRAIDEGIIGRAVPLWRHLVVVAAITAVRYVVWRVHHRSLHTAGADLQFDLRAALQERLGRQSFAFHDEMDTGELLSRADSDIRTMQLYLVFAPAVAVLYIGFLIAVGIMLAADVVLTVIVASMVPAMVAIGVRMRTVAYPRAWLTQARMAEVSTVADENLEAAQVLRAVAAEDQQIAAFDRATAAHRWAGEREVAVRARYQSVLELTQIAAVGTFVMVGGLRAVAGDITIGTFVMFVSYVGLLQLPIRMTGFAVLMAQRARAGAIRILELVDHPFDVQDGADATVLTVTDGAIEFENVSFRYPRGDAVLHDLDLRIEPGETLALVGATGSGKSTLVQLVPRFYDVTSGAVRVDGRDVRDVTQQSLRAAIGLVMEDAFLFTASVRENIAYARPGASDDEVWQAAVAAGAAPFIEALPDGLDTVVGERGHTLSGGQKQRISIARALLQDPRILLLDDATSAIDVTTEREIHSALQQLLRGRTTLVVAHRPATVALADRAAVLQEGSVCCVGTPDELAVRCDTYRQLFVGDAAEVGR